MVGGCLGLLSSSTNVKNDWILHLLKHTGKYMAYTPGHNIKQHCILSTERKNEFHMILVINSDCLSKQQK
jgi:hypothetical protein